MALKLEMDSDLNQQKEWLYRELDKGIRDMEQGDLIPHEETIKTIRARLQLDEV